jgi:hypothetical protein
MQNRKSRERLHTMIFGLCPDHTLNPDTSTRRCALSVVAPIRLHMPVQEWTITTLNE